jgi:Glutathione S-transferase N-terminal domain/Glutathione S-transferase, C-terminal domain
MITLYGSSPMFGLPQASPFVAKAELLLKLSGLPYKGAKADLRKAPKGKMPYIDDDGVVIPDSAFIRMHLEKKHGIDFSGGYSAYEQGVGWALNALLEDHIYWLNIHDRWMDDENFFKGPVQFFNEAPAIIRPLIVKMVRKQVRKNSRAHGLGRHTAEERLELGKKAVDSVSNILGGNTYALGKRVCGTDASVYGVMNSLSCSYFRSEIGEYARTKTNIVDYLKRMTAEFYPEFANA